MNKWEQEKYYFFETSYRDLLDEAFKKVKFKELKHENLESLLETYKTYFKWELCFQFFSVNLYKHEKEWWLTRMMEARKMLMSEDIPVDECLVLLAKKNIGYSNDPWKFTGLVGISSRCIEKICRIIHGKKSIRFETKRDTYVDYFNYTLLALLFLEGKLK